MKKLLTFAALLVFSCETVVEIDVPFDGPRMTLNCVFNPDSTWNARITLNRFILDDSTVTFVDDAEVTVAEIGTGLATDLQNQSMGFYKQPSAPQKGKTYSIKAISNKYGTVEATSYVPAPAVLTNAEVKESLLNHQWRSRISITFPDDPGEQNYYHFAVYITNHYFNYQTKQIDTYFTPIHLESEDPVIQNENDEVGWFGGILFKDVFFNGETTTMNFKAEGYSLTNSSSYQIVLQTLSEDYYQYRFSKALHSSVSGDPLAQPVNVYTNVAGGFGIVAGFSQSVIDHSLPTPEITSLSTNSGRRGEEITIFGSNLLYPENFIPTVYFHSEYYLSAAQVLETTPDFIRVIIPPDAISGKVVVYTGPGAAVSPEEFIVLN